MSQQSVRQAARRSALEAQAVRRKERADRARRLEGLAVAVLTALGECDGAVRDCAAGRTRRRTEAYEPATCQCSRPGCAARRWTSLRRLRQPRRLPSRGSHERPSGWPLTARCSATWTSARSRTRPPGAPGPGGV
jgi:hypothetical protein